MQILTLPLISNVKCFLKWRSFIWILRFKNMFKMKNKMNLAQLLSNKIEKWHQNIARLYP
jgi:hypothetical protein